MLSRFVTVFAFFSPKWQVSFNFMAVVNICSDLEPKKIKSVTVFIVSPSMDEAQAGIKISRRNINNLRYADDTTLMAESEEDLKSLLMKVKEESDKAGLKLNIQKTKIMAFGPITSWQIDGKQWKQ